MEHAAIHDIALTPYSVRNSLPPFPAEDDDGMKKSITPFKRWRKMVKLTQPQTAELFGCSTSHIEHLDAGVHRGTGKKVVPSTAERIVMTLKAQNITVAPWPIDDSSIDIPEATKVQTGDTC